MEIERKYWLAGMPQGVGAGTAILQGYLSTGDPEVRIRAKGGKYFATRKGGEGLVRSEDEVEISRETFDILWPATEGRRIEKIRYELTGPDGLIWEVDQYQGRLKGLFTAELELENDETAFMLPVSIADVFLGDVTYRQDYKNKNLALADGPPR